MISKLRYMLLGSSIGFGANLVANTTPRMKSMFGKKAYAMSAMSTLMFKNNVCSLDYDIDHGVHTLKDVKTEVGWVNNARTGDKHILQPLSLINDGLFEVTIFDRPLAMKELGALSE